MQAFRAAILASCFTLLSCFSFSQPIRSPELRRLSKADQAEFLLDKSKRQKRAGITALVAGPVLTGAGLYMFFREQVAPATRSGGSWVSNSAGRTIGGIMGGVGVFTTLTGIPLLIFANKTKKEANLILADHSIGFFGKRIALPSVGLQLHF